jgi:hypothetical protein
MTTLDAVLEQACRCLAHGGDHEIRKKIAEKLLKSAAEGNMTFCGLESVARSALAAAKRKSARRTLPDDRGGGGDEGGSLVADERRRRSR